MMQSLPQSSDRDFTRNDQNDHNKLPQIEQILTIVPAKLLTCNPSKLNESSFVKFPTILLHTCIFITAKGEFLLSF